MEIGNDNIDDDHGNGRIFLLEPERGDVVDEIRSYLKKSGVDINALNGYDGILVTTEDNKIAGQLRQLLVMGNRKRFFDFSFSATGGSGKFEIFGKEFMNLN
ncbi:hypothetical protein JW758_02250 [Candidatus Peregrinibacteria bacterium]|nr:hypothetical protein [Candidatus Peregrinibacteria bacterium]